MINSNLNSRKLVSIIVILLIACLSSWVMTGCSSSKSTETKEAENVEKATATSEGVAEGTTAEGEAKEGEAEEEGPATIQEAVQNQRISDIKDVKALFADTCGACHANDGTGLVGPNIKETKLTYTGIKLVIEKGLGNMPAFKVKNGELSDEQINRLADYVAGGIK